MTGPEHYREAERILAEARAVLVEAAQSGDGDRIDEAVDAQAHAMAVAQVHATLALAATTAMPLDLSKEYDG